MKGFFVLEPFNPSFKMKIKLAILDAVPSTNWHVDGGITDGEKFVSLLAPILPHATLHTFYVTEGQWPKNRTDFDAYLITGSPCGVHDGHAWIEKLQQFVQECVGSRQKLVGVCFGHQLVAHALGGTVARREKGWFLGLQGFDILQAQPWMKPPQARCEIFFCNQDHVTRLPESAQRIGSSALCENSAYVLGKHVLGLQGHPEQPKRAMMRFFQEILASGADPEVIEQGKQSLIDEVPDAPLWASWIGGFLQE